MTVYFQSIFSHHGCMVHWFTQPQLSVMSAWPSPPPPPPPPSHVHSEGHCGHRLNTGTFGLCRVSREVLAVLWWRWDFVVVVTLHCLYQNDSAFSRSNKMALITAHLNAESFRWWQCNVTNITNVTAPLPPQPVPLWWHETTQRCHWNLETQCHVNHLVVSFYQVAPPFPLAGIVVNMLLWLGLKRWHFPSSSTFWKEMLRDDQSSTLYRFKAGFQSVAWAGLAWQGGVRLVTRWHRFDSLLEISSLFNSCGLWTLPCDFAPQNSCNIKMALITAHQSYKFILVATV